MNIDLSKLLTTWYQNEKGEVVSKDSPDARTYHNVFPCQVRHEICSYFPENEHGKRFGSSWAFTTTYCKQGQDCIVAMVNSGDYTLAEAIRVYTTACERCSNVLIHKYLKDDGYEEHSTEWYNAGTLCVFCKDDELDIPYQEYCEKNNITIPEKIIYAGRDAAHERMDMMENNSVVGCGSHTLLDATKKSISEKPES